MLRVLAGRPATVLAGCGGNYEDTLLVLGPHHERRVFDFGGTTREVLGLAARRVWVQIGDYQPVHKILVPIDLSDGSASTLGTAHLLARALGATLEVMFCFEPPSFAYDPEVEPSYVVDGVREKLRGKFEDLARRKLPANSSHTLHFVEGEPAEAILERHLSADLIVMGSHGHSLLSSVMLGSQAYRVLKQTQRSIVIVPQIERE